jgi:hypothetical protein
MPLRALDFESTEHKRKFLILWLFFNHTSAMCKECGENPRFQPSLHAAEGTCAQTTRDRTVSPEARRSHQGVNTPLGPVRFCRNEHRFLAVKFINASCGTESYAFVSRSCSAIRNEI